GFEGGRNGGQVDEETGAGAGFGLDADASAVRGDDAVDDGKSEPGAFADGLGGEEGFEDVVDDVGRNAGAVVGNGEEQGETGQDGADVERRGDVELHHV